MPELWIRRGGLLIMAAAVVLVAVSGGADLSLGVFVPFAAWFVLFGTPQWFLRRRTRVEPRLAALELFELACATVMSLCLPRGSSRGTSCLSGADQVQHCYTDPTRYTVPIVHLFTGDTVAGDEPWLLITIWAAVLGTVGALVLWVLVYQHLRNDGWRDLDPNRNPAAVSWATLRETGGPSTTRPATREATPRPRRITDADTGS